ncbi:rhodanese-like domain-containing protein [Marinisporobacter balticus]|uniref:Rhodanese-related sulfurtransferase n=1 Tax=Marinisporobacter balticus TaxID=2018667 RepID=A0A4R2KXI6_9FIRM|nr:rhodanese-like domain-containing protein [Marinisporobacter balticus]TCO78643.1 rhodanese-related sulfurtransferase [Marinisporobacter balticus]
MLRIFVMKKRSLYIALALLVIMIIGIVILMSGSDETFSETMKYAYKQISAEQAKVLLEKNPTAIVFDIRDAEKYLQSHLPSATQISYKELKKKLDYYDREEIYMIYGSSDKKSAKAADMLASNGFCKIYMLNGGIEKWTYETE